MNAKGFEVGDLVTWTSQAGGHETSKRGVVVAVVPGHEKASACIPNGFTARMFADLWRDKESYLIQVGKSKRLYWPLVKYLKPVKGIAVTLPEKSPEVGEILAISKVDKDSYEMEWRKEDD